ncbi:hypothetical protein V8F20_011910 [Naviculisporaceae sp. PSN 640]
MTRQFQETIDIRFSSVLRCLSSYFSKRKPNHKRLWCGTKRISGSSREVRNMEFDRPLAVEWRTEKLRLTASVLESVHLPADKSGSGHSVGALYKLNDSRSCQLINSTKVGNHQIDPGPSKRLQGLWLVWNPNVHCLPTFVWCLSVSAELRTIAGRSEFEWYESSEDLKCGTKPVVSQRVNDGILTSFFRKLLCGIALLAPLACLAYPRAFGHFFSFLSSS